MATVLMPLAARDFDPTESAVSWKILTARGHTVRFATPDGLPGKADERMLTGDGLGIAKSALMADINGRRAYDEMVAARAFQRPQPYAGLLSKDFDALVLPGGHAPGMKQYLESPILQSLVAETFREVKPVAAICHGVLLAARSKSANGRSVLFGKKTTALTKQQELSAWALTYLWLRDYYRTYPMTVQDEVTQALAHPIDFVAGPISITRDTPSQLGVGFTLRDGNYLSARWPGDAHRFASEFATLLDAVERTQVLAPEQLGATGKQIA